MQKWLNQIHSVGALQKISKKSIGMVIVTICFLSLYFQNVTVFKETGTLPLYHWMMPSQAIKTEVKWYAGIQEQMKRMIQPVQMIYATMPYFKNKSMALGLYDDELAGYFSVPKEKDIISLDGENKYIPTFPTPLKQVVSLDDLTNPKHLMSTFYMGGDGTVTINEDLLSQWDFKALAEKEIRIDETIEGPKILIFHTHNQERFSNEDPKEVAGIVKAGEALKYLFEEKYGIETLHVTDGFSSAEKNQTTTGAYERMEPVITSIIEKNPSIQVVIDLHRDGVQEGVKLVGDYKGKQAAKFMFVNGLCQFTNENGEIVNRVTLENPYIADNLAFSLQAQIEAMKYYPELIRKIYIKSWRYSLHMHPNTLLVEIGADTNTLEEALLTVEPIADVVAKVLQKD
ncbi:MAG: stage II sporulation protein P [Cellulosilyticaceae bacterium]